MLTKLFHNMNHETTIPSSLQLESQSCCLSSTLESLADGDRCFGTSVAVQWTYLRLRVQRVRRALSQRNVCSHLNAVHGRFLNRPNNANQQRFSVRSLCMRKINWSGALQRELVNLFVLFSHPVLTHLRPRLRVWNSPASVPIAAAKTDRYRTVAI